MQLPIAYRKQAHKNNNHLPVNLRGYLVDKKQGFDKFCPYIAITGYFVNIKHWY